MTVFGCQSGAGCEPACVPAHDLNDRYHLGIVNIGVFVYLHAGGRNELCSTAEARAVIGAEQIIINSFWYTYDTAFIADPLHVAAYLIAGVHGVVAAVIEKVPYIIFLKCLEYLNIIGFILVWVGYLVPARAKLGGGSVEQQLELVILFFAHIKKLVT